MNPEFKEKVDQTLNISNDCVKTFRLGDTELGYKRIIELIENMQVLILLLENRDTFDEDVRSNIKNMNSILIQISEAIMNRDSILIADLIEYELIPIVSSLKQ